MSGAEISNNLLLAEIQKENEELKLALQATEVKLTLKIEEINHRLIQVERENEEQKSRVEILERKKNSILIFGFERKELYITVESIIMLMKNLLHIELVESDFNNIFPLGNTYKSPVKVEFTSFLKKIGVLRSTKNLKGTLISIAHDLTEHQRIEFKILRMHLHTAKQDKNNTCYIRNNRFHVKNRIFTPSDLKNLREGFEHIHQNKPQSDPGTPAIENITNNTEESIEEPIAALPPPTENKTFSFPDITSGAKPSIQVTPKTGAIKKSSTRIYQERNQIHAKILSG
ncbi:hypothetical protein JTB14_023702 [Gonioctena quinquepunctata]|nr:hypothetical protein JTB14_023702 [Gonioctena quinquepunctata]